MNAIQLDAAVPSTDRFHAHSTVSMVQQSSGRIALLSKRQREVLRLIAAGATNSQISSRLAIASATVEHHVKDLKYRLGVDSRCVLAIIGYFEVLESVSELHE